MATLEKRVEVLEQSSTDLKDLNLVVVFIADGESKADALARSGNPPDTHDAIYVSFGRGNHAQS